MCNKNQERIACFCSLYMAYGTKSVQKQKNYLCKSHKKQPYILIYEFVILWNVLKVDFDYMKTLRKKDRNFVKYVIS